MDAFFLPMEGGGRFCVLHTPAAERAHGGGIVYVHAFAEEMNKSRRVAALQARALAERGWVVLQIDLFGCGDSAADLGDATWERWIDDVCEAASWLRQRTSQPPALWGLRTGCLLAANAAARMDTAPDLLFWQPVLAGSGYLQQFLRLRSASGIVSQASAQSESTESLRERLAQGETIHVAGYALSPALAASLGRADLAPPAGGSRVTWREVRNSQRDLPPGSRARIQNWQSAGYRVDAAVVQGDAFWQNVEVYDCPELIASTLAATEGWRP